MIEEDGYKEDLPVKITINDGKKPAEIYRTDFITAMKIPDQQVIIPGSYYNLVDSWKQEWERGVQVPVNKKCAPQPSFSVIAAENLAMKNDFRMPYKLINHRSKRRNGHKKNILAPMYNLDDEDMQWLRIFNKSRKNGQPTIDELLMEKAIGCLENQCYNNMGEMISTAKGLSIEYDEDIACDICRSPDFEEDNVILFCDVCDVAVHQACYGVKKVPVGSWVCQPCLQFLSYTPCLLCSTRGGAMKKTKLKGSDGWVHLSCAVWIPEVKIGNVEKMEPITNIENVNPGRWNLLCSLCKEKRGACIQCSVKSCVTAFHVTCGFDNDLHMQTVWDESMPDGVRHVSYCLKHTQKRSDRSPCKPSNLNSSKSSADSSPCTSPSKSSSSFRVKEQEERDNLRQNRLRGMEEEFYSYANAEHLADELNIAIDIATAVYRFWTLKRKSREDAALLPPTPEQQELLSGRQIKPFQKATMEAQRIVRLRQDLERIRNLCYMIEKREKYKRELLATREAIFYKQNEILGDNSCNIMVENLRTPCIKDWTVNNEQSESLDLRLPVRPKVYKKRGRKPKKRRKSSMVLTNVYAVDKSKSGETQKESEEIVDVVTEEQIDTSYRDLLLGKSNGTLTNENSPREAQLTNKHIQPENNKSLKLELDGKAFSDSHFANKTTSKEECCRSSIMLSKTREASYFIKTNEDEVNFNKTCITKPSAVESNGTGTRRLNVKPNAIKMFPLVEINEIDKCSVPHICADTNNFSGEKSKASRKRLFDGLSATNNRHKVRTNDVFSSESSFSNHIKRMCLENGTLGKISLTGSREDTHSKEHSNVSDVRLTRSRSRAASFDALDQNECSLDDREDRKRWLNGALKASCASSLGTRTRSTRNLSSVGLDFDENGDQNVDINILSHFGCSKDTSKLTEVAFQSGLRNSTRFHVTSRCTLSGNQNVKPDKRRSNAEPDDCRSVRRKERLGSSQPTLGQSVFFGRTRVVATTSG